MVIEQGNVEKFSRIKLGQILKDLGSSSSGSSSSDCSNNGEEIDSNSFSIQYRMQEGQFNNNDNDNNNKRNLNDGGVSLPPNMKRLKQKPSPLGFEVPPLFLTPLRVIPPQPSPPSKEAVVGDQSNGKATPAVSMHKPKDNQLAVPMALRRGCKQFWKAGDYDEGNGRAGVDVNTPPDVSMDHVRVHPKFLHSNATSHKWALGAFAELLDNSMDEVSNGATYVSVDVSKNDKDGSMMLVVQDNGGGMTPDKIRMCMSLGYSAKSKMANTIGQYGNGFKTSTMRLGADVIVLSRSRQTQSIGLLSYTFLTAMGKEDIVVPMIDFEKKGQSWDMLIGSSFNDWEMKLTTILQWSPFFNEEDLFEQFNLLGQQGTRILIYNLWEDDEENLELDFDTDPHDIQIRGVNRDEKNIEMAKYYPNSRHFLTYKHSLRSYASILYLNRPNFIIILRGIEVEHHNLVNDMMHPEEIKYRPFQGTEGSNKGSNNMVATGIIGFVKDAKHHIDVQGYNIYHKNRLIKPFWRVWNPAGSDGRGVIAVLEANFVEPAHDKQGFENTNALSKLQKRLIQLQKNYWSKNCEKIGYAARGHSNNFTCSSTEDLPRKKGKPSPSISDKNRAVVDNALEENTQSPFDKQCDKRSLVEDANEAVRTWTRVGKRTTRNVVNSVAKNRNLRKDTSSHSKNGNPGNEQVIYNDVQVEISPNVETGIQNSRSRSPTTLEEENRNLRSEIEELKKIVQESYEDNIKLKDMLQDERQSLRTAHETIEKLRQRVREVESKELISCKIEKEP